MLLLALLLVIIQVAVAKVKDRIAAATYRITLVHAGYSIYFTIGREMLLKLPLPLGIGAPTDIYRSLIQSEATRQTTS